MTPESKWLAFSVLLGLASVLIAGAFGTHQRGLMWNASNRDGEAKPLTGAAARAARANANFLETFPFFAAAVLAVAVSTHDTPHAAFGAALYFWARVFYLPVYIIGIPYLRTLVWAISIWGILQIVEALL
jgi:uncharacterized MAPEG superfamily protein